MVPAAPSLFSTTTGTPSACDNGCANTRAAMSLEPPAENPTTSVMGRCGKLSACAHAGDTNAEVVAIRTAAEVRVVLLIDMGLSPWFFIWCGCLGCRCVVPVALSGQRSGVALRRRPEQGPGRISTMSEPGLHPVRARQVQRTSAPVARRSLDWSRSRWRCR
ncbi:hypothetical protein SDC9_119673 [bioreactor metagenome]|uniref:Uncharacterized protein n=1 Tax=bioreactor metagenome TaxID=1076179 RepID=A0A645C6A7_9ZZZZ